jgi:Flp pilus assembly protein TadG
MSGHSRAVLRDNAGVAAIEFAIAAPVMLLLILGIWNAGVMLFAQNGIRNAVESGARHATIFPRPAQAEILERVNAGYYGPSQGMIDGPSLVYGVQNNAPIVTITMSYTHETALPFLDLPPVTLRHERTAYLAPALPSGQ